LGHVTALQRIVIARSPDHPISYNGLAEPAYPMEQLRFLLSLTTDDNGYQREQRSAAERAARASDVSLKVIHANNDVFEQSQQLLEIIQSSKDRRPDAIIVEPVSGTGLPRVAQAAISAGIGWAILNCDVDYIAALRSNSGPPAFAISSDHLEIGRIQGRQLAALLPHGGFVLHIQGPAINSAAKQRTDGMNETKPENIHIKPLRGQWSEDSAFQSVASWLRLSTAREGAINMIASQNDSMAMGARKAFEKNLAAEEQSKWLGLPFVGVDGLPQEGKMWVDKGLLTATIIVSPNADVAVQSLARAFQQKSQIPERTLTVPKSYPGLEKLGVRLADG
jgi:ribose transport system substrate-binding protein